MKIRRTWNNMIVRTREKFWENNPTYKGTYCSEEFKDFNIFKDWTETQPYEGMELDKDILVPGNKYYSKETCIYVPRRVNTLLNTRDNSRSIWGLGVIYDSARKRFKARTGGKHLGWFITPEEAHAAWQIGKAQAIVDCVHWWQTDPEVKHNFSDKGATSLLRRAKALENAANLGLVTKLLR